MQSDSFREIIKELEPADCLFFNKFEDLYKVQVSKENISFLEDMICAVEMHIAALDQVSKRLKLKKRYYYLNLVDEISERT